MVDKLTRAMASKSKVDDIILDGLEDILVTSDADVDMMLRIIKRIEERAARNRYVDASELKSVLRDKVAALLAGNGTTDGESPTLLAEAHPYVIMIISINDVGKTTTIGEFAYQLKRQGRHTVLDVVGISRVAVIE